MNLRESNTDHETDQAGAEKFSAQSHFRKSDQIIRIWGFLKEPIAFQ